MDERSRAPRIVTTPHPQLDLQTSPLLGARLREEDASSHVVFDAADVEFCDSLCLRALVAAYQRHQRAGGSFCVANASGRLRQLVELTGLEMLLADDGPPPAGSAPP